jgi:hypothetical protein
VFKRLQAFIQRLPQLFQRTKDLEQRVGQLERQELEAGEAVRPGREVVEHRDA